jgi:hypothetical protein
MIHRPYRERIATVVELLDGDNQVDVLWELRESLQRFRDTKAKRAIRKAVRKAEGED